MTTSYHFSFEEHWRSPLSYWVHLPVPGQPDVWDPPSPPCIPHKGYVFLHVEFEKHELLFSSPAQLDHFIAVLASKPLPTTRYLSGLRNAPVGPNGHWLSRLPAALKAPRKRAKLVQAMQAVHAEVVRADAPHQFAWAEYAELLK